MQSQFVFLMIIIMFLASTANAETYPEDQGTWLHVMAITNHGQPTLIRTRQPNYNTCKANRDPLIEAQKVGTMTASVAGSKISVDSTTSLVVWCGVYKTDIMQTVNGRQHWERLKIRTEPVASPFPDVRYAGEEQQPQKRAPGPEDIPD